MIAFFAALVCFGVPIIAARAVAWTDGWPMGIATGLGIFALFFSFGAGIIF